MRAARNGKQVAVVLELKARFDEEANIKWATRMERAGIHVTYGVVGLKTHTKITLVVRQDYDGLRRYAHLATGNYHAGTARLYTDLGLFTCDDAHRPRPHRAVQLPDDRLQAAPQVPEAARRAEACSSRRCSRRSSARSRCQGGGERGHIQWKINALEDVDIVRALYRASQRGVTIDLIVRDTLPAAARARRRVEHDQGRQRRSAASSSTRAIYYFHNGGRAEYYIGSADAMQRNLEKRVEVLVPDRGSRACRPSCATSSTPSSRISAARGTCSPTAATSSAPASAPSTASSR